MHGLRSPELAKKRPLRSRAALGSLIVVCWLGFLATVSRAEPIRFLAGADYWRAYPSGTMTITQAGRPGSGTRIDLSDDLDLGAADVAEGAIGVGLGRHLIALSYQPLSASGEATLARGVVFHGREFSAGERVRSDVDLRSIVPRYDYAVLDGPLATLRAGLQADVWTFEARLRGSGVDESRRFTHVLPGIELAADVPLGGWTLGTSGSFGIVGSDRYAIDLAPEVRKALAPWCSVSVGYRWRKFEFHETTNRGDLVTHGPFASLGLGFNAGAAPP